MTETRTPNTIIAGMPKCGTTSLFGYLAAHPQVCGASVKETCVLMDPDSPLFKPDANLNLHGEKGYSAFFGHCHSQPIRLESTPDYFYQATALNYMGKRKPRPKLIFVLREPARRVYSLFRFAQNNLSILNRKMTFTSFLDKVRKGEFSERPILQNCLDHSRYHRYLLPWFESMGTGNILLLTLEALNADPRGTMARAAAYLNIDAGFYAAYAFNILNPSIAVRWSALHSWKRRLSKHLADGPLRKKMGRVYGLINVQTAGSQDTDHDRPVLDRLKREFVEENRRLVQFGLDVSTIWESPARRTVAGLRIAKATS